MKENQPSGEILLAELGRLQARLAELERENLQFRATEEALAQSEARYRQMFEKNLAVKLVIDPDSGAIVDANSAAARFYGYSLDELKRKNIRDINASPEEQISEGLQEAVLESQTCFRFPHRLASGEIRTVEIYSGPVQVNDRVLLYSIITDITDRIRTENELRESAARLSLILEQTPAIHWTTDRNLRITSRLGSGLKRLFLDSRYPAGVTLYEYLQTNDPEYLPIAAHLKALQGESVTYEMEFSGLTFHSHIEPLRDSEGKIVGTLGIALDITERAQAEAERRKLEFQIQESQKLESLGMLAGGIAHEFNNLLTGVIGNASLALLDLREDSPARYSIQQIEKAAVRAADLTRQMLAFSGRGRFVVQPLDLSAVIQEMTALLHAAVSKKATVRFELAKGLPPASVDAAQIKQVVMNLATNASDALGDQTGMITIKTGFIQADRAYLEGGVVRDPLPEGPYAYLEVSDNGTGIADAVKHRIFEPFFSTKFTGRGLGLAAVLGIVRGHKGTLCFNSIPGAGSTFRALFPCAPMSESFALSSDVRISWMKDGAILVIDDEHSVRSLIHSILKREGLNVVTAGNGQEGLAVFQQDPALFCCVLLDLTMPVLSGEQVFHEIHFQKPSLPVILMSGYSAMEVTARFSGKGLAGFLQKPFRPDELLKIVRQAVAAPGL